MGTTKSRVDKNQPEIVEALRSWGASVIHLHELGRGRPDILVYFGGILYLIEIKSDGGKLTIHEQEFFSKWPGHIYIVRNTDDAKSVIYGLGDHLIWRENKQTPKPD